MSGERGDKKETKGKREKRESVRRRRAAGTHRSKKSELRGLGSERN